MKIFLNMSNAKNLNEEAKSFEYVILPIGNFYDPRYEWLNFTEERIAKIVENYKKGIPSYKPPINIEHDDYEGKFGEIVDCKSEDGLKIKVECSEKGWELVKGKKFEYMSAEIRDYFDKKTGESVGEVLVGAALTNKPANPYVGKIELSEKELEKYKKRSDEEMTIEELQKKLDEERKKNEEFEKKLNDFRENNRKLAKEKKEKEIELKEKEWIEKGVPPIVVEEAKKILLAEETGEIKLSDGSSKTVFSAIEGIINSIPKIDMEKYGKDNEKKLSDKELGEVKELEKILEEVE